MFSGRQSSVRHRRRGWVTAMTAVALAAGCLAAVRVIADPQAPTAAPGSPVPVQMVHGRHVRVPVMKAWRRPLTSWPATAAATVTVTTPPGRPGGRAGAGPSAGSRRAGRLPVWLGPLASAPAAGAAGVWRVRVSVASHRAALALGVKGMVVSLVPTSADVAGQVHVSVSYAGFAQAYGGDYGSRLHLVELPGCALTDPGAAVCRTQTPLRSLNDARRDFIGADVRLPGTATSTVSPPRAASRSVQVAAAVTGQAVVLAVAPGPSGSAGNYAAEPLSEQTNDWVTGPSSGAYTYSYPITSPPVPGGLAPAVALDYDSQATSGLTSATNNQASWVGEGWEYSPGFIETDYTTCSQQALVALDTSDLCAGQQQVAMSLNGETTPLVDGSGGWRAEADSGATIKQLGTAWEVIQPNGVQYYFGLGQLPGYTAGDPLTNSSWTVPVWEGCGQAAFCSRPWRDNLDYVVDPHGDAIAYFYTAQTNYYAEDNGSTGTGAYTQGGTLATIEYGLRAGQVYTSTPAAQVLFTTTSSRQDAPTDLTCAAGAACAVTAPTFWASDALTTITTQALEDGALTDVDSYALATSYPATGDPTTAPSLWLDSITRTGLDGSTPISLPPVTFSGTPYPNRVQTPADTAAGYSDLTEEYLTSTASDTGAVTNIGYSPPDPAPCAAGTFPAPDANTAACYPDYWTPPGGTAPVQDWFNVYSVATMTTADTTSGDPPVVTSYAYAGPAWHYDNDTVSRSATVTWDEWRGFQTVTAEMGTPPDPVVETATTFLQGMSQDGPVGATGPVVTVTTSRGQTVTDSDQFAGMQLEQIAYDGAGTGQEVTDAVNLPWSSSATAVNSGLDQAAYMTGTSSTVTYTPLADGGTRDSITDNTYNSYGLIAAVSAIPDTSNPAEDTCTATTYAVNTATWLMDLPATQVVDAGPCNASGDGTGALVSQTDNFYDGGALGAAPTAGNLTKVEKATAAGFFDTTTFTYDQYGRVLSTTDPDRNVTTTDYTPATGAEPTAEQVTDPMGLVTTTSYDPARELPLTVTDPAGDQTTTAYDALGRKTAQWTPGNPTSGPANTIWSYAVSSTAPSVTTEQVEGPGGTYLTTDTIDDSLGQVREIQTETADGGTDVTDTTYNSDGWKALVSGPYYISGPPSGSLVQASSSSVPSQTGYVYDGDGRVIRQISYSDGAETWETDTSYGGNETTVTPPAGGTAETTWTNGEGETTAIWQYHAGAPVSAADPASDYDATSYTYTPAQKLATITDAAGNVWSYTYDLLGDQLTQTDPDAGTSAQTYDGDGNLISVTDALGKTISYAYDADGRKIAAYDTTGGAAETSSDELASWTYDTLAKGLLTSSSAYEDSQTYTTQITGYNSSGLPASEETVIPASQGALAGTYTQSYTYAPDGQVTSYTDSAADGLPAETVTIGYDSAGEPDSLTGASPYVDSLSYTDLGQPLQYTLGTSADPVYVTDSYDPETGSLTQQDTQAGTAQTQVDDLNYSYNDVGDVTSEADTPSGDPSATDVQCFIYDYLNRLVQAWAEDAPGCTSSPSASAEGGAAPYWDSYSYNTIGNLTGITSTTPAGQVTTTTDSYPAAGDAQPHAITAQSVASPSGTASSSYGYNAAGELTSVTSTSQDQALAWNDAGQLTQDAITPAGSSTAQNSSYIYDAAGNLLLTADPGTTTLYLPDEELSLDTSTGTVTGTRYYTLGNTTVATLTSTSSGTTSLAYLISDQQGTSSLAISATNLGLTRRYYDPYGNLLSSAATSFPAGEKGFVGGAYDAATGLTDLGAREYQSQTGSFISPDPILTPSDPQDLNAYTYAADNPTTNSDPTGQSSSCSSCQGAASTASTPGAASAGGCAQGKLSVQVGTIWLPCDFPGIANVIAAYNSALKQFWEINPHAILLPLFQLGILLSACDSSTISHGPCGGNNGQLQLALLQVNVSVISNTLGSDPEINPPNASGDPPAEDEWLDWYDTLAGLISNGTTGPVAVSGLEESTFIVAMASNAASWTLNHGCANQGACTLPSLDQAALQDLPYQNTGGEPFIVPDWPGLPQGNSCSWSVGKGCETPSIYDPGLYLGQIELGASLGLTTQILDEAAMAASANGPLLPFVLFVGANTKLSPALQQFIANNPNLIYLVRVS
jgi:RHS repeat-associated protein